MKRSTKTILAAMLMAPIFAASLTACSSTDYPRPVAPIDWRQFKSIRFNAAQVQVVNEYQSRGGAPNIDQLMERNPSQAVEEWANGTLRAGGTSGYVQVRIKDASVITRDLEKIGGVQGYFTKQQDEELVAHLSVEISGDQRDIGFNGYTSIEASQLMTVPENATKAQRQAIEQELVNRLITQFAQKAEQGILTHLHPMIRP